MQINSLIGKYSFLSSRYKCIVNNFRHFVIKQPFVITSNMSSSRSLSQENEPGSINNNKKLISICHMRVTNDKEANLLQVKRIIEESKKQKSDFVFLPECCDYIGENRDETLKLAEPLDGKLVSTYKSLAKEFDVWLSLGGIHEAITNENGETVRVFNSHVIINNIGEIVATYQKLHMFDVDTPEFRFRESVIVAPGEKIVSPIDTPIGPLGLQICYDMRFPEVSTLLRYNGAKILTYPSAFAYSTGLAHWEILLRSRAIETQCYVIAAAQIGFHNKKRQSYGHGIVVDPWGKIIAQCDDNETSIATATIDIDKLENIRRNMPCYDHRRKDVYSLVCIKHGDISKYLEDEFSFSEIPIPKDTIFYCTDKTFVFTNIRCVVPGHILVATRRPAVRLKDLSSDEVTDFFQTVCKLQKFLESFYNTTSSTVTVQDGEDAGQTVKHVHCHIMPRRKGDFEHNDLIYAELNKHDSSDNTTKRRPLEEMVVEAQKYREALQSLSC